MQRQPEPRERSSVVWRTRFCISFLFIGPSSQRCVRHATFLAGAAEAIRSIDLATLRHASGFMSGVLTLALEYAIPKIAFVLVANRVATIYFISIQKMRLWNG